MKLVRLPKSNYFPSVGNVNIFYTGEETTGPAPAKLSYFFSFSTFFADFTSFICFYFYSTYLSSSFFSYFFTFLFSYFFSYLFYDFFSYFFITIGCIVAGILEGLILYLHPASVSPVIPSMILSSILVYLLLEFRPLYFSRLQLLIYLSLLHFSRL